MTNAGCSETTARAGTPRHHQQNGGNSQPKTRNRLVAADTEMTRSLSWQRASTGRADDECSCGHPSEQTTRRVLATQTKRRRPLGLDAAISFTVFLFAHVTRRRQKESTTLSNAAHVGDRPGASARSCHHSAPAMRANPVSHSADSLDVGKRRRRTLDTRTGRRRCWRAPLESLRNERIEGAA